MVVAYEEETVVLFCIVLKLFTNKHRIRCNTIIFLLQQGIDTDTIQRCSVSSLGKVNMA